MEKNILLVDDEHFSAKTEALRIEKQGFNVTTINSGKEAIGYIMKNDENIDLILMDIELNEEQDGIEIANRIQKNHNIPIIFLTSHEEPKFLKRAEKTETYNYLLKNMSGAVLANAIHQALKLHKAQQKILDQNKYLQKRKEQYKKVVQSSRDAMAVVQNNKFQLCNQAFIKIAEVEKDEIIDKPLTKFDIFKKVKEKMDMLASNDHQEEIQFEFEMITSPVNIRYVKARLLKIDIDLKPAFFITLYDMTEQKELLKKIAKAKKMTNDFGDFIPICASCKKIRDEDQEGSPWIEPEIYINNRLPDVQFSHGICPDCRDKLYPEFMKNKKNKIKGDN